MSAVAALDAMISTVSQGYCPIAASPESITASAPSNTAVHTSFTSARVGTARNWAEGATDQDASTKLAAGGARVVVSETTYARLTAALLRRRVAVDARAAIVTLTRHGILPSSDVRDYFDGSDRTSKLYRTLFAEDAPDEVEEWYDNLPNRRAAQLDPQRERLVARRLVATTRLAGEKPHS